MSSALLLIVTLLVLVLIGCPIVFCIVLSSSLYLVVTDLRTLSVVAQRAVVGMDSFVMLAVPLFTLAGYLMEQAGLSKRLTDWVSKICGRVTGATGMITIICCAIFAALTGSGPATVAAIGAIMIPALKEAGYSENASAGMLAAGGALGPIIPPSVAMIVYGSTMGVSIPDMFMGGVVPGIIIAFLFCVVNYFVAKKENVKKPTETYTFKEIAVATWKALPVIAMPIIVLGGIYAGIFTPTEAATVCVLYSLILGVCYRTITVKILIETLKKTIISSASIALIIGISSVFGLTLAAAKIPAMVAEALVPILGTQFTYMLVLMLFLFAVGCLMECLAAIVILAPILGPIGLNLGCDPLHLGVIFCINLVVGFVTPPFGVNLFTAVSTTGTPYAKVVKGVLPYLIVAMVAVMVFAFVPGIITWLPNLMKG